jgi:NitT/TauT family transport system permease protein
MTRAGWIRLTIIAVCAGLLEAACRLGYIEPFSVVAPSQMVGALVQILATPELQREIASSLLTIAIAVACIVVVGTIIGVILHPLKRVRRIFDPLLSSYYALPLFAFYPLFIVLLGVGAVPIILMGFITGLGAMVLSTLDGLDAIPPVLRKIARIHQMSPVAAALKIQLPAAAPYVLQGMRLAVAYGFIGVIASEFILSGEGLGFEIGFAYNSFDTRRMYGLILFILLLVIVLNLLLNAWDELLRTRRRPSER